MRFYSIDTQAEESKILVKNTYKEKITLKVNIKMYSELFEINSYKQITQLMRMYNLKKKYNNDYIMLYSNYLTQPLDGNNENNNKLLKELEGVPEMQRGACYRCVIVFMRFSNDPFPFIAQDSWRGRINNKHEGTNGFGYDPIFFLPDQNMTSAELRANDKHEISHRGKALSKFSDYFKEYVENF